MQPGPSHEVAAGSKSVELNRRRKILLFFSALDEQQQQKKKKIIKMSLCLSYFSFWKIELKIIIMKKSNQKLQTSFGSQEVEVGEDEGAGKKITNPRHSFFVLNVVFGGWDF